MAKQGGMGDNFYLSGYDLSGDIGSLGSISGGPALLDRTGINKYGVERIGGRYEGSIEWSAWFNDSAGQEHSRLSLLPRTDQLASFHRGTSLGGEAANLMSKQVNYDASLGDDGGLSFDVEASASAGYPLEWSTQLTAGKRTDTTATNGTGVDQSASSSFGLSAYLHVFSFTGTSVTVKIQHSNDNASTDPYADITGATFTAA